MQNPDTSPGGFAQDAWLEMRVGIVSTQRPASYSRTGRNNRDRTLYG